MEDICGSQYISNSSFVYLRNDWVGEYSPPSPSVVYNLSLSYMAGRFELVRTGTSEKSAVHNDGVARAGVVAVVAAAIFLGSCLEKTEWLIVRGNDWNFNVIPSFCYHFWLR